MLSNSSAGQNSDLNWLLTSLIERVPNTNSALLLSSDGLKKAFHGLDADQADHLAAISSGLFSLARSAGSRFGDSGAVRQIVAELDQTLLFVSAAGSGAVLAVLASRDADAGVLGYEMVQMVKSVRPYLATPARRTVASPGESVR